MLKIISVVDVDTFIEKATKIVDKVKRNPNLSVEAKQEARILLEQLEECLGARLRERAPHTSFKSSASTTTI